MDQLSQCSLMARGTPLPDLLATETIMLVTGSSGCWTVVNARAAGGMVAVLLITRAHAGGRLGTSA
ncbi:hypothetical protein MNEG_15939, partial [Monoraphidium neglectum]